MVLLLRARPTKEKVGPECSGPTFLCYDNEGILPQLLIEEGYRLARVTVLSGPKVVALVALVTPFSITHSAGL